MLVTSRWVWAHLRLLFVKGNPVAGAPPVETANWHQPT